jgi:hypothetical protein
MNSDSHPAAPRAALLLPVAFLLHLAEEWYGGISAVTGLLLYVPLSVVVLRASATELSKSVFASSILFGVLIHGLISYLAFI